MLARPSLWWDFKWPLMKGRWQGRECSPHACSAELAERMLGQGRDRPGTLSCRFSAAASWPHQTGTRGPGAPRFARPSVWQLFAAGCGRGLGRNTLVAFLYGLCTWGSLGFFTAWWPQRSQIACVAPRTRTHSSQGRKPLMICPWKSHASLPPSGPANHKGAPGTKKREHRLPPQYDELLGWEAMRLWPRNEAALPFMSKLSQPGSPKKPPLPQVYLGVSQRYSISHCRVGITSVRSHACCPRVHGTEKFTEQVKMLELHGLLNQLKTDS